MAAADDGGAGDMSIVMGSTVLIQGRHVGIVMYIGTTEFDPQKREWIGVELERAIGKHDGSVKGVRYFVAKDKHGTFVPRAQCEMFTEEKAAALKIQGVARIRIARNKVKEEAHWKTFNMIDNQDEHLSLQRRSRIVSAGLGSTARLTAAAKDRLYADAVAMPDDATYSGPTLTLPDVTRDQVAALVEFFRQGKSLPYKQTVMLLYHFERKCAALETMQQTTVNDGERLTIVGDTHGQLQDLFSIFTINGLPTDKNRYLVNGDFVDRGPGGAEIVLVLFAMFLWSPKAMMLNRGNHEERSQNEAGGFMNEVFNKYKSSDESGRVLNIYEMFHSCFDTLPLATLIEKNGLRVFVVHGGLFDRDQHVKLEHISKVMRRREIPWGRETMDDRIFEDMMWSDPRDDIRGTEPSTRGAGVFFGEDITERFCAQNGVSLVVRSHECVKEGYLYQHKSRCLTIFSASRYCGTSTNSGAFIVFDPDLTNVVQQFVAGPLASTAPKFPDAAGAAPASAAASSATAAAAAAGSSADAAAAGGREAVTSDELDRQKKANRSKIIERIVLHKADLFWYFTNIDKSHSGRVSRRELCEGLASVLRMPDLPWNTVSYDLVEAEPDNTINYAKFLERYRIALREEDDEWQDSIVQHVCTRLFGMCASLEDAYRIFDINADGRIEYSEFVGTLEKLDIGLTRTQIYELMRSIDTDKDSHIDFKEFASRFRIVFTRFRDEARSADAAAGAAPGGGRRRSVVAAMLEPDEWTRAAIHRVGTHLFAGGRNAAQVFASIDTDQDDSLSFAEFTAALAELKLDPPFSEDEVRRIMTAIDSNGSGKINYVEFLDAFRVVDSGALGGSAASSVSASAAAAAAAAGGASSGASSSSIIEGSWQRRVIEQVVGVLYEYRIELKSAFEKFDLDGSGLVSAKEFRLGLKALTGAVGATLSDMQADALLKALDKNNDGQLSYQEFLDGFRIIDVESNLSVGPTNPAPSSAPTSGARSSSRAGATSSRRS